MAEKKLIDVETRLGLQQIEFDKVLRFPKGIFGFEDKRDFVLLQINEGVPFLLLQSVEAPSLGLMVANPYSFVDNFSITLTSAEQQMLHAENNENLSVLVTVSIPAGKPDETCLNMSGPIIINHEARLGLQIAQTDTSQPGRVFLEKQKVQPEKNG